MSLMPRTAWSHARHGALAVAAVVVSAALARGDAQNAPSGQDQPVRQKQAREPRESAGQGQPGTLGQPTFRVEANFVRVDVYPTTDGRPVGALTAADFEVLEDGVPQKIETFEHVIVRGNTPQDARREPNTAGEGRAMAEDRGPACSSSFSTPITPRLPDRTGCKALS